MFEMVLNTPLQIQIVRSSTTIDIPQFLIQELLNQGFISFDTWDTDLVIQEILKQTKNFFVLGSLEQWSIWSRFRISSLAAIPCSKETAYLMLGNV